MQWYHEALGALAVLALIASWHQKKCRLWVGILAVSYIASVIYYHSTPIEGMWLPRGAAVAFFLDAIAFIIIREFHDEDWEFKYLGTIMAACATMNAIQTVAIVSGWPPVLPQDVYSSILEVANAAYLMIIGGKGILERTDDGSLSRRDIRPSGDSGMAMVINSARKALRKKTTAAQPLRKW